MKMMAWAKVKVAAMACLGILAAGGVAVVGQAQTKPAGEPRGTLDLDFVKTAVSAAEKSIPTWDAQSKLEAIFYHPRLLELDGPREMSYTESRVVYVSSLKWRTEVRLFDLNGKLAVENWQAADGSRIMTYAPFRENVNGNLHPNGRIMAISRLSTILSPRDFLLDNVDQRRGLSELLANHPARIVSSQLNQLPRTVTIEVDSDPKVVVTLDTDKGFSLIRTEIHGANGKPGIVCDKVVLKKVGEFWFPISGEQTAFFDLPALGGYAKAMANRMTVDESSLKIGQKLDESLFRFEYPKGTFVGDDLTGVSYFVGTPAGNTVIESSLKDMKPTTRFSGGMPVGNRDPASGGASNHGPDKTTH